MLGVASDTPEELVVPQVVLPDVDDLPVGRVDRPVVVPVLLPTPGRRPTLHRAVAIGQEAGGREPEPGGVVASESGPASSVKRHTCRCWSATTATCRSPSPRG